MAKRFGLEFKISRLMLHLGLMCARLKRFEEAEQILRAIQAYRDDLPHPHTFLALSLISQGRLQEAAQELDTVLRSYPDHQMGKALLGLVQRHAGQAGWQRLPHEVIEDGRDEHAIKLAQATLGLAEEESTSCGADTPDVTPRANMYERMYV